MKILKQLLVCLAVFLFIKIVSLVSIFSHLEDKAYDTMFLFRDSLKTSGDVVVVAIDDNTFQALNNLTWPYPRSYHAKLIENLNRAGAKQIIFDIEFMEEGRDPHESQILADTAAKYGNVVFAGKVIKSDNQTQEQLQKPLPVFIEKKIPWGIVNTSPDVDGFIRKYQCFEIFDKKPAYTLGVASIGNSRVHRYDWDKTVRIKNGKLFVAGKTIPLINGNKALINYYGPCKTFKHISYASVIDDETMDMPGYEGVELDEFYDLLNSGILKNKIVLVGATIDEMHDLFPTPFSSQYTAGVEIHANFIEMVRNNNYLYPIHPLLLSLIQLLLIIILWFAFKLLKPQFSAVLAVLLMVANVVICYNLFKNKHMVVPIVETLLLLTIIYMVSLVAHYLRTQKEKKFIKSAFQQYMSPELVKELLRNPKSLSYGGALQELSVLFSDIRSFTTYSENHKPEETVQILKEYLTEMVKTIIDHQGIVDKFVGDEIMALYGTPIKVENHALSACKTALDMRTKLTELQEKWKLEGRESFEIGIGINTGIAVVGNLGSEQIFDYTAIGDTINLGARLEAINKEYQTKLHIIISEFTLEKVEGLVQVRFLDSVKVKGKNISVKIYELLGLVDSDQAVSNEVSPKEEH